MGQELLLVGSIPLKTVEDVMRTFGGTLGRYLPAIPDGEVGERRSWVLRLSYQVFNGHIDLDTIKRPARVNGVEQLMPRGRDDVWQFKVKPGVDAVRFGDPGYRLGYAKDATNSYFVFKTLRENGVIPQGVRFQISMPMVNSVVRPMTSPNPRTLRASHRNTKRQARRSLTPFSTQFRTRTWRYSGTVPGKSMRPTI